MGSTGPLLKAQKVSDRAVGGAVYADIDPAPGSIPPAEKVREQLKLIVESSAFSHQTKARQFLVYIVEQTLAGNGRKLKQYSIATEALGRSASFDPALDPIVRLEAGKLRKSLDAYYLKAGGADRLVISVPKGSYVPTFAYCKPGPVFTRDFGGSPALDQSRLLVVAPLGVPEGCKAAAYGLFEQLTVELARYNDFAIISSEGATADAQFVTSPYVLASQYNARFVVTSGAAQSGNKVRITIRLCDVSTESIIWIESFDFDLGAEKLVEKQDRAARRVAADIADIHGVICRMLSVEAASRNCDGSWSAHTAILQHRYLARINNERVYRRARADLEYGIEVAPYNSKLWAALAHTIFTGNVVGFDEDPDWLNLVERYSQHSFELDHRCAYGYVVAATLGIYNRDLDGTLEICRRIIEDNPRAPSTTLSAGFFRSAAGDWDTGAKMLSEALEMVSHPPGWAYRATFMDRYRQREYSRALFEIKHYYATEHFTPSLMKAAALGQLGREEEARTAVRDVLRICPQFPSLSERYFRSITGVDSMVDHLKEGLARAGLAV